MKNYSSQNVPSDGGPLKALILAGGRGKRLNDFTNVNNKCLFPFRGKPLIEYSFENAQRIGITEIVVVVGYLAENIINKYGTRFGACTIQYVIQHEQLGLVHAIECAKEAMGGSDFLLMLGDEFFIDPHHGSMIRAFYESNAFVMCGITIAPSLKLISNTYSILFDEQSHRIYRLIEKPENPTNSLMGTGNVLFRNGIFRYIDKTPINQNRGERELPDLIQCAIDDGKNILYHSLASEYVNVNTVEDISILKKTDSGDGCQPSSGENGHGATPFHEGAASGL
jgi:dTDP-glucose pyrophosphorylase